MSDTDDTDLLLLIPPNFFFVQSSDSEDCEFRKTDFIREKNEIERAVVNDLITQVNELESRICAIESSDYSCAVSCNEFCNRSLDSLDLKNSKLVHETSVPGYLQMPISSRFTGSVDNVRPLDAANNSSERESCKLRHPFSLPSTPSSVCYRHQLHSSGAVEPSCKVIVDDSNISSNSSSTVNSSVNHKIPHGIKQNSKEVLAAHKSCGSCIVPDLISKENSCDLSCDLKIDDRGMEDDLSNQLNTKLIVNTGTSENSNHIRTEKNTVKMSDNYKSTAKPLKNDFYDKNENDMSGKHLELADVDKLLKEMEETQIEIEKKLKSRELHYSNAQSDGCKHSGLYKVGETINSVPDLGYGVRELFYHKSPESSNNDKHTKNSTSKTEVNDSVEEPFTQRKISTLGHSVDNDYNKLHGIMNTTPVSSPHTRFSCNEDNRESMLNRARKKIDFNSSKDNPITFIKSPAKMVQGRDYFPKTYDNAPENNSGTGFDNSDGNSSADDKKKYEEVKKKILFPQRAVKSKIKHPRLFKEFDKRCFRNVKPSYKYTGGERTCSTEQSVSRSSNLMSLSDLWNSSIADSGVHTESDPLKLSQKLEEEKYRRQHCERLILELQKRVLDDQERLAVAVQVDKEKDIAIKKLWDGWQNLAGHWKELEEQRHALSKQLEVQSDAYESQAEDIKKKVDRWEKELSKALDLAAGYKEKCHSIAKEREELMNDMEKKLQEAQKKLSNAKDENLKYMEENNKLTEQLNAVQSESEKIALCERLQSCLYFMRELDKQLVSEYQTKLIDVEQKLKQLEAEISILREQKETLSLKLKDEMVHNKTVTEKNLSLQKTVDDYRKQEKILKDEVKSATESIELSRIELRALYQGQLEAVVKEKLREFQSQLNAAEAALRAELMSREKELAEQAAYQCHTMAESHKLEIAGLNERHRSQLKAFAKRIQDLESQKIEVELKLKHETEGRSEIAQKLHSVMETQWRQALSIISNATASGDTKSQMEHSGKSYEEDIKLDLNKLDKSQPNSASSSNQDTAPFNKSDAMSTYRLATSTAPTAADVKRTNNSDQQHLKKYIEMLLDRTPGNPVPRNLDKTASSFGPDDIHILDSSYASNDSFLSDNPAPEKHAISKEKGKFSHRQSGPVSNSERRQQLQNINRFLKHQPWK